MAADLHIHVFEGITEKDLEIFFSNVLGSKYCHFPFMPPQQPDDLFGKISETPDVWIGEVSWLKAGLSDDAEAFIPTTVQAVTDLIGEDLPLLTEELRDKILGAFDLPNTTGYKLNTKEKVAKFLNEQKGKKLFCISW